MSEENGPFASMAEAPANGACEGHQFDVPRLQGVVHHRLQEPTKGCRGPTPGGRPLLASFSSTDTEQVE